MTPSITWPFGTNYSVEHEAPNVAIITTRSRWPWSKPKQWRLTYNGSSWFWGHNGQWLQFAPEHVWRALDAKGC